MNIISFELHHQLRKARGYFGGWEAENALRYQKISRIILALLRVITRFTLSQSFEVWLIESHHERKYPSTQQRLDLLIPGLKSIATAIAMSESYRWSHLAITE